MATDVDSGLEQEQEHYYYEQAEATQTQEQEQPRIFLVTDGVKSPYTKQSYRNAFNHFLSITFEIQSQSKQNLYQNQQYLRTLLDYKPSVIESRIIDYVDYLKSRKLAYPTIQARCAAIFHFFEMNDVNLNTRKIKRRFPQDESENMINDRPYSVNEIELILPQCDVRSRVAILLMASTGMRIGGLRELRYGDIKRIDEFGLYLIWVYNRSRKDRYFTFVLLSVPP